jgi:hypothetical protein
MIHSIAGCFCAASHLAAVFAVGTDAGVHYDAMQFTHVRNLDSVPREVIRLRVTFFVCFPAVAAGARGFHGKKMRTPGRQRSTGRNYPYGGLGIER